MRRLIDFFNHGTLPFVGRGREAERLMAFWRGTADAQGVRAVLLSAEAGIGKSRLLQEFLPRISGEGGTVVHVKLYPDSATSLVPMLARAVCSASIARRPISDEVEVDSVVGSLRRLVRLRPTLLVLEDIHLLGEEAVTDLTVLLQGVAHESLALLCLARPQNLPLRPVLERYLVDEIELTGFTPEEMGLLWKDIFGAAPDLQVLEMVHRATLGNALALRSALRGILKSEALVHDPGSGTWRLAVDPEAFAGLLQSSVQLLSEGMAAHLNPREKNAAGVVASLGEVFSREAAVELLGEEERMLDVLLFKGVLGRSGTFVAPIGGGIVAETPMVFTHTLVHRYFVGHADVNPDRLLRSIVACGALYSIVPFQLLAERAGAIASDPQDVRAVVERALSAIVAFNNSPDWKLGVDLMGVVELLFRDYRRRWTGDEAREIEIRICDCKLALLKRLHYEEEFGRTVVRQLELTRGELPEELLSFRIAALAYRHIHEPTPAGDREIIDEVESLIARRPELRFTGAYILFLGIMAISRASDDTAMAQNYVRPKLGGLLADAEIPSEIRLLALREVAPHFLWSFQSPGELRDRLDLLAEMESSGLGDSITIRTRKLALFVGLGRMREVMAMLEDMLPWLRDRGMQGHLIQCRLHGLYARAALGANLNEIDAEVERLYMQTPEPIRLRFRRSVGVRLIRVGLLRDDREWIDRICETFAEGAELLDSNERMLLADRPEEVVRMIHEDLERETDERIHEEFGRSLARLSCRGEWEEGDPDVETIRAFLRQPPLTLSSIVSLRVMIEAIRAVAGRDGDRAGIFDADIRAALVTLLEWLADLDLPYYMAPLTRRYGDYLESCALGAWLERIAAAMPGEAAERNGGGESRGQLRLYMIGSIEVEKPREERSRIRGARLRTLLGLMTIDRMLKEPLSYREFCRLAAGGEDDPERSRKMMSMGVLRLRESLGAEMVLTAGEAPRLNPDLVRVDLLEVNDLLNEAGAALRSGSLARARQSLVGAMDLVRGEVIFPGLYDTFFEAAREEFEIRLRTTLIEVSRGLASEGDAASAEQLARRGVEMMPEDEELTELLCDILDAQGKKLEAERVRIRAAETIGA